MYWNQLSHLHIIIIPSWFVIVHAFLFSQCFWFHYSVGIVQLAVFSCVDLVEIERETLTILQTQVETLLPVPNGAKRDDNIPHKSSILLLVIGKKRMEVFSQSPFLQWLSKAWIACTIKKKCPKNLLNFILLVCSFVHDLGTSRSKATN